MCIYIYIYIYIYVYTYMPRCVGFASRGLGETPSGGPPGVDPPLLGVI